MNTDKMTKEDRKTLWNNLFLHCSKRNVYLNTAAKRFDLTQYNVKTLVQEFGYSDWYIKNKKNDIIKDYESIEKPTYLCLCGCGQKTIRIGTYRPLCYQNEGRKIAGLEPITQVYPTIDSILINQ